MGVILHAADGLFKPEVIERHPIIFLVNVEEYLSSLVRLGRRAERYVLPGHGELIDRQAGEEDPLPGMLGVNSEPQYFLDRAAAAAHVSYLLHN